MIRNKEKINRLADLVESCRDVTIDDHEPGIGPAFSMARTQYECGAPGCILGHNGAMHGRERLDLQAISELADDLGITIWHAEELCAPEYPHADYTAVPGQPGYISAARAADCLRNLADTGVVSWIR